MKKCIESNYYIDNEPIEIVQNYTFWEMYFPSEVSESTHACMLTHFVFARGVS